MTISINPSLTVAPPSSFLAQTKGFVQGLALADPVANQWLATGAIDSAVTQPLWGGIAITENVAAPGSGAAGNTLDLATTQVNVTGFTVFNRGYNMITTPGNTVQTASAGMSMPFFRLGSNIRIPVKCSSALITAIESNPTNTQVQWDFTNQQLIPYASGTALNVKVVALDTNSKTVSYNSGTGAVTWVAPGNVALIQL
jgi:hypothetical protein